MGWEWDRMRWDGMWIRWSSATVDTLVGYMYVCVYPAYLPAYLLDGFRIGMEIEMGFKKSCLLDTSCLHVLPSTPSLPILEQPSLSILQQPLKEAGLFYKRTMYVHVHVLKVGS